MQKLATEDAEITEEKTKPLGETNDIESPSLFLLCVLCDL